MFSKLKNHPFAIQAHFEYSVVLSYAVPQEDVVHLIPDFLKLDLWDNKYAFFTVALVKVNNLRPKGLPGLIGQNFYLVGHRLFVQYINEKGKRLRGLYILKSQTDKKKMTLVGNMLTHYKYELVNINSDIDSKDLTIRVKESDVIRVSKGNDETPLPVGSVFSNWKEARRFAGPLPFTFSALKDNRVLIVEGKRSNWIPQPLKVEQLTLGLNEYSFMKNAILSNAFIVEDIPYEWKKGTIEQWKG